MNPMLTVLYLDAKRAESSREERERHLDPASNHRVRRSRRARRWF